MHFTTTVNLNSSYFQLVLASQKSGTFFCIYARFEKLKDDNYKVFFVSKNYRGYTRIGIEKVELVKANNTNYYHFRISVSQSDRYTDEFHAYEYKDEVQLKKNKFLLCEREDFDNQISTFVGTNEYINIKPHEMAGNETHYEIEKKLFKKFLNEFKAENTSSIKENKAVTYTGSSSSAASRYFCVIGISKLI